MRTQKLIPLLLVFFLSVHIKIYSQFGAMPPFTISIEAIEGTNIPGMHSFAFARSGDKWLIIGGRTNGLHSLSVSGPFAPEDKNDKVVVIDTTTWTSYTADLNQLPFSVADPLRSTNMEYIQDGDYLYMAGGYGYDSIATKYVTFSTLSAIHVDNMINAVINAQPIAPHIRQISNSEFVVCGGDLGKIGNDYYMILGHDFKGRYSHSGGPLFIQNYKNRITKFNMTDDGTTITVSGFTPQIDTNNFHRRDLNVGPIVNYDNSFGLRAYGGVFQKTIDMPYQEPITINTGAIAVNSSYQQLMSQYTCSMLPVYDSSTQNMYTTFFGGISLYDYNDTTGLVVVDTLVPFISDVTTLTAHSSGLFEETIMPVQLPGLLGANSKFVLNDAVSHYANEVIRIRDLPNTKILAGYFFGGIRAQAGNFGSSTSNDSIYRIYITPNNNVGIDEQSTNIQNAMIYPNPSSDNTALLFYLKESENIKVSILDVTGKLIKTFSEEKMSEGNHQLNLDTKNLDSGLYFCRIETDNGNKTLKIILNK